jgi:S1-C subfamily serine protease
MWRLAACALSSGAALCLSPEEIFAKASPAIVQLRFVNATTNKLEGTGTAFLIHEDGRALTSSSLLKKHEGTKMVVVLPNGLDAYAEDSSDLTAVLLPEVPGIGFIQIALPKMPALTPAIARDRVAEGDLLYVVGQEGGHIYFEEVYLSNANYPSRIECDRVTGKIPDCCIGGPVIAENGEVVGVMYDKLHHMGLSYRLEHLTPVVKGETPQWFFMKAWRKITQGIHKRLEGLTKPKE